MAVTLLEIQPGPSVADAWIDLVAQKLGTADRDFAERVLRAWLHLLRDRLTADAGARLAAELPEEIRDVFYDGWDSSAPPANSDAGSYTIRFARAVSIAVQDVRTAAAVATAAVMELLPRSEVYEALDGLAPQLRVLLNPGGVLRVAC